MVPTETATARGLVLLVDLDRIPADEAAQALDTLRSLKATRVHLVLVTGRSREDVEALRGEVPGALWAAERGRWCVDYDRWQQLDGAESRTRAALVDWVRGLTDGATVVPVFERVPSQLASIARQRLGS